ncbi:MULTISPECIES: peptidoglycan-binding protein [unclassified Clostridium]|uniref:peptidoglycan-binding protein n=1 Tax=unclassified Clostridium TaxID=2614128 RepID=UPI000EE1F1D0|nr:MULTISPECIES: peptidoglycan-binding protein [unclassified Clostridium]HCQ89106.1 spore cortex-lytic protein [Clostridium sp.]
MADTGKIMVNVYRQNSYVPVTGAKVTITPVGGETRQQIVLSTNSSGQTEAVEVSAPPIELTMDPQQAEMPYSLWNVNVEAEGYEPVTVEGCQVVSETTAIQNFNLANLSRSNREIQIGRVIIVPDVTLFGNFPPKIPEDPEKALPPPPTGFVVLPEPIIPEYIVVHAGAPTNPAAPNYRVPFKDYIKNVASCEIYATWPESTIRANIYCIISFTLNRIYTEWYRGKGYNFDITNSTAFDHAFTYGRNIFDSFDRVVDEVFTTYIRRRGAKQPLLAQYCDGQRVKCPGWLTQWGSKYLGDQGKVPYEILTNFYGSDIDLVRAERVAGSPQSYPGYTLGIGSTGEPVRVIQTQLNRIAQNYPLIPKVAVDGVYGPTTAESVKVFQRIFNLPQTGTVDYATWYQISNIYVGVTRIAELRSSMGIDSREARSLEEELNRSSTSIFIPPTPYKGIWNVPRLEYPMD